MKNKDRMALKRHAMPMVDMHTRTHDRIQEVAQGFTLEMAMDEARRCIDCAKPTCREGCPIHMNIPPSAAASARRRSSVRAIVSTSR